MAVFVLNPQYLFHCSFLHPRGKKIKDTHCSPKKKLFISYGTLNKCHVSFLFRPTRDRTHTHTTN